MNKIVGFGVTIVLCMAAAGIGAYLALRPQPSMVPAAVVGTGSQAAQVSAGAAAVSTPAAASDSTADGAGAVPVARAAGAAETPASAAAAKPAKAAEPVQSAERVVAGATSTPPPVSAIPPVADKPAAGVIVSPTAAPEPDPAALPVVEPAAQQPAPPPQKLLQELVVSADSVIGLRIENTINSEVARVEDPVEARVSRDVRVGSEIAIAAGARMLGSVIQVERGGKMKTAARVGVRFHTLVLADGTRTPMQTEAIYREGASPGKESAAKVGGATAAGAILGAIIGGGKGAAIGGAVGAAGGTGVVMAGGRNPAILAAGTSLTVRLSQPVTVVVEKEERN